MKSHRKSPPLAAAEKHVLCVKPLGLTVADAEAMAAACYESARTGSVVEIIATKRTPLQSPRSPTLAGSARVLVAFLVSVLCEATAANWPAWRGPTGDGLCTETNVPTRWTRTEQVRWRTALPEAGNSTPVVWGDRVFVTQGPVGHQAIFECILPRSGAFAL